MMENYKIVNKSFSEKEKGSKETIFALANGYMGIRGTIEFCESELSGTFIQGVFNKRDMSVPELVNLPDPLSINVYMINESGLQRINLNSSNLLDFSEELDMRRGVFLYSFSLKTENGYRVNINSERFISWKNKHRWAVKYRINIEKFSGRVLIENTINNNVYNNSMNPLDKTNHFGHFQPLNFRDGIGMFSYLTDSNKKIIQMCSTVPEGFQMNRLKYKEELNRPVEILCFDYEKNREYCFTKYGVMYSNYDLEDSSPEAVEKDMRSFLKNGYDRELKEHRREIEDNWERIDIKIDGDDEVQRALRWCIFQLNSSAYKINEYSSIGAKGLHGEGYKGHVFWDTEIFMFPFFLYTNPEIARTLLMYRYNTLPGAIKNGLETGYKGARFPWESEREGVEVTPKWGMSYKGEKVRILTGDHEYHIVADIALSIYHYYRATLDEDFMMRYGAEILFQTGIFWNSRLQYNNSMDRYEIRNVMGPDEFHEEVDNNVYTNFLARWNLKYSAYIYSWMKQKNDRVFRELTDKIKLFPSEVYSWKEKIEKIYIPRDPKSKVIEQFEGYFELKEYEIKKHDENGMPLWPDDLDTDELNNTTLLKQPDLLMLMYLMPEQFTFEEMKENYDFYEKRTMHKSSLSPSIHCLLSISVHEYDHSYEYFKKTLLTDLSDNQGNSVMGIHAASTGGAWLAAVMGFGRFYIDKDDMLNFDPWLPKKWNSLSYKIIWRGNPMKIEITHEKLRIKPLNESISFKYMGKIFEATVGESKEVKVL